MKEASISLNKDEKVFDLQRKVVSHMVSESWTAVPHVTYLYEPDITDFYESYLQLHARLIESGVKITFNTLLLYIIAEGLKAAPELNAYIEYDHARGCGRLRRLDEINISIPWMLGDGRMITPVLCGVQAMSLKELSEGINELQAKIEGTNIDEMLYSAVKSDTIGELKSLHLGVLKRVSSAFIGVHRISGLHGRAKRKYYGRPPESRLESDNLRKGTVTVSNIGSLYKEQQGCFGLLEIIPPQIFAIGLGAAREMPGVFRNAEGKKEIGIRRCLPMCLEFDHRAVDFNAIVPFLKRLDAIFASPEEILNL